MNITHILARLGSIEIPTELVTQLVRTHDMIYEDQREVEYKQHLNPLPKETIHRDISRAQSKVLKHYILTGEVVHWKDAHTDGTLAGYGRIDL